MKKRKAGDGRTRRVGAGFRMAALLATLAAPPVLEAQERGREGRDRRVVRVHGNFMSRGMLGIRLSTRPADADAEGAEVRGVVDDGPAEEAGLREGDVVTALDGHSLLEPLSDSDLEERVDPDRSVPSQRLLLLAGELEPGEEVEVEYLRDGATASATVETRTMWGMDGFDVDRVHVVVEEARERAREAGERAREAMERMREEWEDYDYRWLPEVDAAAWMLGPRASHGLDLTTLNPELGRYFDARSGALVTEADEDNPLGLEAGDVILAIDGRVVDSAADARRILRSYDEGETATLEVVRDGERIEVSGEIEDRVRPRRRGAGVRGAPNGPPARGISVRRGGPRGAFRWAPRRAGRLWRNMRA